MTEQGQQNQGFGAVIATGVTAQVLGGAIAVVFVYYFHQGGDPAPPEAVEQALGTIFSTAVSTTAMIGHLVLRKFLNSN